MSVFDNFGNAVDQVGVNIDAISEDAHVPVADVKEIIRETRNLSEQLGAIVKKLAISISKGGVGKPLMDRVEELEKKLKVSKNRDTRSAWCRERDSVRCQSTQENLNDMATGGSRC